MGRRAVIVAAILAACPASAIAAPVVELGPGGHARTRNDPYLTGPAVTPAPTSARGPASPRALAHATVASTLTRLQRSGAITPAQSRAYAARYGSAVAAARRLRGLRARELGAVIANLNAMAASGWLTASRLPVLFLTLDRNRQWWTTGPLLSGAQRVEFTRSQLVWQYYPGQGIELQVLGSFGKADGLYTAGRSQYSNMLGLLGELIPLAVSRGGGAAWEYYFNFDGGRPPWVSAMSQGTALEALSRAYRVTREQSYLSLGHSALSLFGVGPPTGVRIGTPLGSRYLQYSFAPHTDIINAYLQSLIGLDDFAHVSGDHRAGALFAAGDAQARSELPQFDTGAWSLYQPGIEDSLSYHELVTGFLGQLCSLTRASVYCVTAQHFATYEHTPPVLKLLTHNVRHGVRFTLRFRLSKYSHVGVVVPGALSTSGYFGYGTGAFSVPALKRGTYAVRLAGTDLAGNFARITDTIRVS